MNKIYIISFMLLILFSCEMSDYGYIEKAEIINENAIDIYFSGNISELDPNYDIGIIVNNVQNYYIRGYSYNIFKDNINGLKRYHCRLNKNLLDGDKIEIKGLGRSVFGTVIVYFHKT